MNAILKKYYLKTQCITFASFDKDNVCTGSRYLYDVGWVRRIFMTASLAAMMDGTLYRWM